MAEYLIFHKKQFKNTKPPYKRGSIIEVGPNNKIRDKVGRRTPLKIIQFSDVEYARLFQYRDRRIKYKWLPWKYRRELRRTGKCKATNKEFKQIRKKRWQ